MTRWTSMLGALLLVLMLWTGSSAHAAERFDCIPVTAEASGHFEGDRDQKPASPDKGVAHHHSGCSGHHMAAPGGVPTIELAATQKAVLITSNEAGAPGRRPDNELRPPIA